MTPAEVQRFAEIRERSELLPQWPTFGLGVGDAMGWLVRMLTLAEENLGVVSSQLDAQRLGHQIAERERDKALADLAEANRITDEVIAEARTDRDRAIARAEDAESRIAALAQWLLDQEQTHSGGRRDAVKATFPAESVRKLEAALSRQATNTEGTK